MNNTTQNKLADMFAKRFEDYNTEVLEKLAKIIKKFNGLTYSQASQLANQLKYDKSYIDLVDELSKLTGKSKKEIKKVLEETVKQHTEFADTFFKARNMETPVYENDIYLKELVNSVSKVSEGDFVNLAKSTGFAFQDKTGHLQFLDMKETYYKVIDECVYAISEGKETYGESIRKLVKQLSDSGVRRIVYVNDGKRQYTQRIDSAVRRNVLDGIREVSIESQKEFGKRFNADGIEVTVHENPAPDHQDVQGKQFRNEEFEKFQNDMRAESVDGEVFEPEYDGRDRRSIGQYNCYHTVFSIIVGVSKPLYSDKQLQEIKERANEKIEIDGKEYTRYETTQLQRNIETQLRYEKDAQMMCLEIGDREEAEKHQLRITQLTRKYKDISKKANIREQLNRASVSGYRPIKVKEVENIKASNKKEAFDINKPLNNIKDITNFVNKEKDKLSGLNTKELQMELNEIKGYNKKPTLIGKEEFDKLNDNVNYNEPNKIKENEYIKVYRGWDNKKYYDEFANNKEFKYGTGGDYDGVGIYATDNEWVAGEFAKEKELLEERPELVMEIALPNNLSFISKEDLLNMHSKIYEEFNKNRDTYLKKYGAKVVDILDKMNENISSTAVLNNYEITYNTGYRNWVILNRGKIIIKKKN